MKHAVKIFFILFFVMMFSVNVFADWKAETPMNAARDQFTGGVINGKLYVFGGNGDPNGVNLKSCEVFDPAASLWAYCASNENNDGWGVEELTGAVVNDRLYVFGASGGADGVFNFVEEYNPVTNTWTSKAPKPTVVTAGPALVYNGEIYVFGGLVAGTDPRSQTNIVEAYNPATNSWRTNITPMPIALANAAVSVVGNKAYVFGGAYKVNNEWKGSDAVMVYDLTTNTWFVNGYAPLPSPQAFSYSGAAPLIDGKVYLTGGIVFIGKSIGFTKMVQIYDIDTNTWLEGPSLPTPIDNHLSLVLNNTIYVIGGEKDIKKSKRTSAVWKLAESSFYYCDKDKDGYVSSTISGNCSGSNCLPKGCQITAGDDCNDSKKNINPNAKETCDGIDNDCDANTADGFGENWYGSATNCGVGVCSSIGQYTCSAGKKSDSCTPRLPFENPEMSCSDTFDNDCDAKTDSLDKDCYPNKLFVVKSGSGTGTVSSSPKGINCGADCYEAFEKATTVKLTAKPDKNSIFVQWTGACSGTNPKCTVTVDGAKDTTAEFKPKPYDLKVKITGNGSGKVSSDRAGIECGDGSIVCATKYEYNTIVTLTASVSVEKWSGCDKGGATAKTCTVTMNKAKSVTANFKVGVKVTWQAGPSLNTGRNQFAGGVIDGKIIVFGGNTIRQGNSLKSTEILDPASGSWEYRKPNELYGGRGVEEVSGAVVNGKLYVFGGHSGSDINLVTEYDPTTNTWISKAPMPTTRADTEAVTYNNKIYVFGGGYGDDSARTNYDVVEAYDPSNNTWQTVTNMPEALDAFALAVVGDKAYVIGGVNRSTEQIVDDVSVYNFITGTWTTSGFAKLPTHKGFFRNSVPVVNGKIYLIGGGEGTTMKNVKWSNKVDIYDTESNTWQTGVPLPVKTVGLSVIVNNKIYVVGGDSTKGDMTAAVWSFDLTPAVTD